MSCVSQFNAEFERVVPAGEDTPTELAHAAALATQLKATLQEVETDLAKAVNPASNGEAFAAKGVRELETTFAAFATYVSDRTALNFSRLQNDDSVAISDWDAGARIVWLTAGLPPPIP